MEKVTSKKFICKYCDKRYPCGKSLGGHLRSHKIVNSFVDENEKAKLSEVLLDRNINNMEMKFSEVGEQSQSQTAYLLREKPKKTWRLSNSGSGTGSNSLQPQPELKICKECGKGFQSVKALCGHMACHSEKDKQKVVVDDDDDEWNMELSSLRQPRRSKRMRDRALDVYTSLVNGGCSSVSESEQEQEDVALCLMMLSRDTRKWVGVSSVESSDNNSTKSFSAETNIVQNGGLTRISGFVEYKGNKNLKLKGREFGNGELEHSDDCDVEYFGGEMNNVESDNSGELFLRDIGVKKPKIRYGSGYKHSINGFGHLKCNWGKNIIKEEEYKQEDRASKEYNMRRETEDDSLGPEVLKSSDKFENGSSSYDVKVYSNSVCESVIWSDEDSQDINPCYAKTSVSKTLESSSSQLATKKISASNAGKKPKSRKSKGHQCPFCPKIFKSGQALGGHKRIHFVAGSEDRTIVMPDLLDLNLPAPIEEEVDGHPRCMPL